MIVTDILDYDKKKVLIELDEYLILPLYKGEIRTYHIEKDMELSEETYHEIIEILLPKRVKLRAMKLLEKRSYTREKLRCKLAEGKYPEEMIEAALDYVTSYGYLDDVRYAEEYIRCYSESRSKRRILQDLCSKGISGENAEKAWLHYEEQFAEIDESTQIMEHLRKKHFCIENADHKEIAKMMSYLYRKGYSMDSIRNCMKK